MTVTDAWTNPSEGGTLDLDVGSTFTDAIYDALCGNLLFLGGTAGTRLKTRSLWAQPRYAAGTGTVHPTYSGRFSGSLFANNNDADAYASLAVPLDFGTLVTIGTLVLPAATGNIYCYHSADYAASAQAYSTHSYVGSAAAVAVTANTLKLVDASAAVASLAANDFLGLKFSRNGASANDTSEGTLLVIGMLLVYTTA